MRKYFCAGLATLALACGSAGESSVSGDPGSGGQSGGSNLDVSHAGTGGGGPKCTRVETISALAIERPEPFDVVIVADHSGSLSWSRDSLSAGLKNLLAYAHGQQVRFFVLTPTQYGASSEAAKSGGGSLVVWKDPVTNKPYSHAITEYKQICSDINGVPFDCAKRDQMQGKGISVKGAWEFQMPEPIAAITPDMTAAQITEQQQKIADGILALGSDGAQTEQPICTLNRYIAQSAAVLPKHAVFMILSDEDDKSTPDECLLSYSYQEHEDGKNDAPCTENCDVYRFEALYMHTDESVEYDCVPVDDKGVHHPENGLHYSASSSAGPLCELGSVKSCGDFEFGLINSFCKGDYVPENCVATCNGDSGSGYYCSLDRTSASPDLCTTSFSLNGTSYSNFPDYCQKKYGDGPFKDCTSGGYKLGVSPRYLGDDVITPVVDVPTVADMGSHFRSSADTAFGKDEYFVESIVLDPAFNCPVNAGQSYGTTLKALATSSTDVYALCNDYAPALQRIQTFAKRLVKNEFPLKLAEDEEVDAVNAVDVDGKRRELAKSEFRFDRDQNLLVVTPGVLGPSDLTLDLTVADTCIEIVR
ncbi:MAG TPA: hypothetical protein VER96_11330 [Polyangiaceae bacterium]|nr:hypothetical protein [Polyangiaceae bacterium]